MQKAVLVNKRAFFVIGPESSGTRMMTQAFISSGAYGDGGHAQKLDKDGFNEGHKLIVLRRSVPHGVNMPPITKLINRMQNSGYKVIPIVILRDKDKCAQSQVKRGHASNLKGATTSIERAVDHIYNHLSNFSMPFHVIHYEPFVKSEKVRNAFFSRFNLPPPKIDFFNANEKYS